MTLKELIEAKAREIGIATHHGNIMQVLNTRTATPILTTLAKAVLEMAADQLEDRSNEPESNSYESGENDGYQGAARELRRMAEELPND